jgi:hypothetical protein
MKTTTLRGNDLRASSDSKKRASSAYMHLISNTFSPEAHKTKALGASVFEAPSAFNGWNGGV